MTRNYPPTMLVHGLKDPLIPYGDPESLAWELARQKIDHEIVPLLDVGHNPSGMEPERQKKLYDQVIAFVNKHVR